MVSIVYKIFKNLIICKINLETTLCLLNKAIKIKKLKVKLIFFFKEISVYIILTSPIKSKTAYRNKNK